MEKLKLIYATTSELDEILALMAKFYVHFQYRYEATLQRRTLEGFLSNPGWGSIWLVKLDGTAVGYVALTYGFSFEFGGRDAFVDEFFIEEGNRNKGIGSWVLKAVQQKMPELGLNALHLQTEADNERAKRLYQSLGFRDLGRSSLTFKL